MKSIVLREIKSFFRSPIGYLVIAIFSNYQRTVPLVFEGDYILNTGFADLTPFFHLYALDFDIPSCSDDAQFFG
jgi:ABC-2 type transport system permease protein